MILSDWAQHLCHVRHDPQLYICENHVLEGHCEVRAVLNNFIEYCVFTEKEEPTIDSKPSTSKSIESVTRGGPSTLLSKGASAACSGSSRAGDRGSERSIDRSTLVEVSVRAIGPDVPTSATAGDRV